MLNLYVIYTFIAFTLVSNVVSFVRVRQNFQRTEKLLFIYLFLSILLWGVSNALADIVKTQSLALFFAQISILFPLNILNALAQTIRNYPRVIAEKADEILFNLMKIVTIVFTVIAVLLLRSELNVASYKINAEGPIDYVPGMLYYLLGGLSIFFLIGIVYSWVKRFARYTKTQRVQVFYLLGAVLFVYVSMSLGLLILPAMGLSLYGPFMFLSLSFLLFIINKSLLVRVAIVDIQEEVANLFGGLLASTIMLLFWNITSIANHNLNLVGRYLISFVFLLIIYYVYKGVANIYVRRKVLSANEIRKFIDLSRKFLTVEEVLEQVRLTLGKVLYTGNITFQTLEVGDEFGDMLKIWWAARAKTPFINREILTESYYDRENNKEITKKIYIYFEENSQDMIIPVSTNSNLIGIINIFGVKKIINDSDYQNLSLLSDSISVSISRALAYQELRNFNELLQQKVNEQTTELQAKVQQLQEARRKERDMIDIMGHELRTPATIAKLNVELLHNLTEDIVNNRDKFELYVNRIQNAVENEIKLINTLLSSAKLEGNRIELNPEEVDIVGEVEMAIHGHEMDAKDKGVELRNLVDSETPSIYADHARIVEVLNNLVDNAIKYTKEGSVTILAKYDESTVTVSVVDTGEGIQEDDLKKLGQKFYRVGNYLDDEAGKPDIVRPGGTGLGLYVTFGLVEKMGGKMEVTSKIGEGSSFSFTLPRYKGQILNANGTKSNNMFERLGLKR